MNQSPCTGLESSIPRPGRGDSEATVRQVFSLIWPRAGIECCARDGCYIVGLHEGGLRHLIRVPCSLVECDQGLMLVRAVYRSGIPKELGGAHASQDVSL